MKQVHISRGRAVVLEVPAPAAGQGEVLVQVKVSCLSVGTEMSGVKASAAPLWKRALKNPEKIATTLKMASQDGVKSTWRQVKQKTDGATPTGYSAAGTVIEVGAGIEDIVPGDRVACAGGGYANHAEYVRVPRNLCRHIPDALDWDSASSVTLGAIAMQGVRRANPTLGETFVVIGLGILGQLTAQLLRVNGCRVIGVDPDSGRVATATKLGMEVGLPSDLENDVNQVARLTGGLGADGAIVTAATPSDSVMSTAFGMCRKKGRVVLVGDVGLNLNRSDFYAKEIDFLISTSYGPGRYDQRYEEEGLDYPAAYVRWTENRNMGEYLRLLAENKVQVEALISASYPIEESAAAYASISESGSEKPMMVLLQYGDEDAPPDRSIAIRTTTVSPNRHVNVAVVGAGSFARSVHLPNLLSLDDRFSLHSIVARNGASASSAAREFGASEASTDYEAVLNDPNIDAVIIATRHHLHASMALAALRAGKHVLVEKPLALTHEHLDALDEYISDERVAPMPVLLTGYNRRFSPYALAIAELLESRIEPFILNYRMNAGHIPQDHWVHGPEGGGRNVGEACHIYDLIAYLAAADVKSVSAHAIAPQSGNCRRNENFTATLSLFDGSVASLTYTSLGSSDYAKESADLYVDGNVAILEDYKLLRIYGSQAKTMRTATQQKGHREELIQFADGIQCGEWPISWRQQLETARLALAIDEELKSGS